PDPAVPFSDFKAFPPGGIAPHVVTFGSSSAPAGSLELDVDGDGSVDFSGTTLDGLPFVYAQPGVYVATLHVRTADGQVFTFRTSVEVYDRALLDARLRAVWTGFKDALRSGNVTQAVSFIHGNRRARWQESLAQVGPDVLATIDGVFTNIDLIGAGAGGAEYEMLREEGGQVVSYPVVFVVDSDGRWRLWQF
ncbi:MAG: hypothetical protein ACRD2A_19770, partial [Vicinamibacterales bacterium]